MATTDPAALAATFKAYDVRGTVPDQVDEDLARAVGNAFVTVRYMGAAGILATAVNQSFQALLSTSSWTQVGFQASAIPVGTTALFIEIGTAMGPLLDGRQSAVLVDDLQFTLTTAAVPEPETDALMLAGLGAVAAIARRRRA